MNDTVRAYPGLRVVHNGWSASEKRDFCIELDKPQNGTNLVWDVHWSKGITGDTYIVFDGKWRCAASPDKRVVL